MEYITKSPTETKELGKKLAANLTSNVWALSGDLGAGKTTFVQGFAEGLRIKNRIISPTFILMRHYDGPISFYHVDLYRLENDVVSEVENLGLTDIWHDPENIILIEWAEKIKNHLPKNTTWVNFEVVDTDERKITVLI